eukprot:NODE_3390_length_986_cov_21.649947_g3116_i0.p1 GENE.NODE_3390_length_986_cov_21.649947_g3116_i0~~NODE_3390_length_986_cov_21.649947_g3116_i0.p1  ORF type:complete len:232 (-),score=23.43 NODE_3390_length_986_cov_21.649947_g3116_i0:159-854(-)
MKSAKSSGSRGSLHPIMQEYRAEYPKLVDVPHWQDNFKFYSNVLPCRPTGVTIEEILQRWPGNYRLLEGNHTYIQWLFPIRERGLNSAAQPLQLDEAHAMAASPEICDRIRRAFSMMLDFYGMQVDQQGNVTRSPNFETRFLHLSTSSHNFLRITRILKFLGELGWDDVQFRWLMFLTNEVVCSRKLSAANSSLRVHWIPTLRDPEKFERLNAYLQECERAGRAGRHNLGR